MMQRQATRVTGPFADHAEGLRTWLIDTGGYVPPVVAHYERLLSDLGRWLDDEGIAATDVTNGDLKRFVTARRDAGERQCRSLRGLRALVGYLRQAGVIGPDQPDTGDEVGQVVDDYCHYLRTERRLAPLTVTNARLVLGRFLRWRIAQGPLALDRLDPEAIHSFVVIEAGRLRPGALRSVIGVLRPFLRFLFSRGITDTDLSGCLSSVAGARFATIPKAVDAATVAALLGSCNRSRPGGRRDYAIMLLLVRLGLRAIEVASMRVGDIDWRAGELLVRGKGGRLDRLPLPVDVGEALVDYLRHGRPPSASDAVFLSTVAPREPMSRNAVVFVSRTASERAGLPTVGAHRLRHTAATEMLRHGASLREVGQVLRHEDDMSTSIYAKVDFDALALVIRPWPGLGIVR